MRKTKRSEACDFFTKCRISSVLSKDAVHSSKTIILIGTYNQQPAVFKISSLASSSLAAENFYYSKLSPMMIEQKAHVVPFIAEELCSNFVEQVDTMENVSIKSQIQSQIKMFESQKYSFNDVRILVTSHIRFDQNSDNSMDLDTYMRKLLLDRQMTNDVRLKLVNDIMFQVALTLDVFDKMQFMHNDLSIGNVLVRQSNDFTFDKYYIGDRRLMNMRYVECFVFDFDHSFHESMPNPILNGRMCSMHHECNKFTKNWDWFQFLFTLNDLASIDTDLGEFLGQVLKYNKSNHKLFDRYSRACLCDGEDCNVCIPDEEALSSTMTPAQFMVFSYEKFMLGK